MYIDSLVSANALAQADAMSSLDHILKHGQTRPCADLSRLYLEYRDEAQHDPEIKADLKKVEALCEVSHILSATTNR